MTRDPRLARLRVGAQPSCDPLTRAVMDRMLAGVSTRKFAGVGEPVGTTVEDSASATSKSTVSEPESTVSVARFRPVQNP